MLRNNNLSPLPFYEDIGEQGFRRSYAYGSDFPCVMAPLTRLAPFQVVVPASLAVSSVSAALVPQGNGDGGVDISSNLVAGGLQILDYRTDDGNFNIVFPADTDLAFAGDVTIGKWYIVLTVTFTDNSAKTYYSEVMTLVTDPDSLLKLEWWSLVDVTYSGGRIAYEDVPRYRNILYLRSEVGLPTYNVDEDGEDRLGFYFPTIQKSEKVFHFSFLATEEICDCIRIAGLSDHVQVTGTNGRVYPCDTFLPTPTWQEQGYIASVECEFQTDTVVVRPTRGIDSGTPAVKTYAKFYDEDGNEITSGDLGAAYGSTFTFYVKPFAGVTVNTGSDTYYPVTDEGNGKYTVTAKIANVTTSPKPITVTATTSDGNESYLGISQAASGSSTYTFTVETVNGLSVEASGATVYLTEEGGTKTQASSISVTSGHTVTVDVLCSGYDDYSYTSDAITADTTINVKMSESEQPQIELYFSANLIENVSADGGTVKAYVNAADDQSWYVDLAGQNDWRYVTYSPTKGTGSAEITITIAANTRDVSGVNYTLKLCTQDRTYYADPLVINQKGSASSTDSVELSTDTLTFEASASDSSSAQTFIVTSTGSWSMTNLPSWATVTPSSGSKGTTTVTVYPNAAYTDTSTDRSRTISIGDKSITITQKKLATSDTITTSTPSLSLAATKGATGSITVTANNSWTITSLPSFVTASVSGGASGTTTVTFTTTDANDTTQSTTDTVVFTTSGGKGATLTLTQVSSGSATAMSVDKTNVPLDAEGDSATVTVTIGTGLGWVVTSKYGKFTVSPASGTGSGSFTISADENTGDSQITDIITVTAADGTTSVDIQVIQAASSSETTLSVSSTELSFGSGVQTILLYVTASEGNVWTISCGKDYVVSLGSTGGTGTGAAQKVAVTSYANYLLSKRTDTITVTDGTHTIKVSVVQAAKEAFIVSTDNIETSHNAETVTITVQAVFGRQWALTSSDTSIVTSSVEGETMIGTGEEQSVDVYVQSYTGKATRRAYLTATDGTTTVEIDITQHGTVIGALTVSTDFIKFDGGVATKSFTVLATEYMDWTAEVDDPDVCTLSVTSGVGTGDEQTVMVTSKQNGTGDTRFATITVKGGTAEETIHITQAAIA